MELSTELRMSFTFTPNGPSYLPTGKVAFKERSNAPTGDEIGLRVMTWLSHRRFGGPVPLNLN
jgi:hypothetical protein